MTVFLQCDSRSDTARVSMLLSRRCDSFVPSMLLQRQRRESSYATGKLLRHCDSFYMCCVVSTMRLFCSFDAAGATVLVISI